MNPVVSNMLIHVVRDLENTRAMYQGYSYVRTIRNILVGNQHAVIAPHFVKKEYYGLLDSLTLEETETMMDTLVKMHLLECIFTNHGKLYCTEEYNEDYCKHKWGY